MKVANVFYSVSRNIDTNEVANYRVYLVPNHYGKSLAYVKGAIAYAKEIGCTFEEDDVQILQLGGPRYNRMTSVEFTSTTKPNEGMELTPDSGLWEWLATP